MQCVACALTFLPSMAVDVPVLGRLSTVVTCASHAVHGGYVRAGSVCVRTRPLAGCSSLSIMPIIAPGGCARMQRHCRRRSRGCCIQVTVRASGVPASRQGANGRWVPPSMQQVT